MLAKQFIETFSEKCSTKLFNKNSFKNNFSRKIQNKTCRKFWTAQAHAIKEIVPQMYRDNLLDNPRVIVSKNQKSTSLYTHIQLLTARLPL